MLVIITTLALTQRNNTAANTIIAILDYLYTLPIFCASTSAVSLLSDFTILNFPLHFLIGCADVGDVLIFEIPVSP